jgi:hypothetical protein
MNNDTPYKNYLIRGESFQREKNGSWIPQYTATRRDGVTRSDFPSQQYQLHHACRTKGEADEFAVRKAKEWIDKTAISPRCSTSVAM